LLCSFTISNIVYYLCILLAAIGFFFLGAWFYQIISWFPRGGKPVTGTRSLIGKIGQVVRDNGTNMVVRVDGQNWNAKYQGADRPYVGAKVKIISVRGLSLMIELPTKYTKK
jgi:membrane protein implicated in regulation of membrane protease activity